VTVTARPWPAARPRKALLVLFTYIAFTHIASDGRGARDTATPWTEGPAGPDAAPWA
jgi:hypothetical protein